MILNPFPDPDVSRATEFVPLAVALVVIWVVLSFTTKLSRKIRNYFERTEQHRRRVEQALNALVKQERERDGD